jgi:hypothetical protein
VETNSSKLLETLSVSLTRLVGSELSIGDFSQWFTNSRWEAVMAANSSLLHLGWDIQNILAEWMAFPELISNDSVATQVHEAIKANGITLPAPVLTGR